MAVSSLYLLFYLISLECHRVYKKLVCFLHYGWVMCSSSHNTTVNASSTCVSVALEDSAIRHELCGRVLAP